MHFEHEFLASSGDLHHVMVRHDLKGIASAQLLICTIVPIVRVLVLFLSMVGRVLSLKRRRLASILWSMEATDAVDRGRVERRSTEHGCGVSPVVGIVVTAVIVVGCERLWLILLAGMILHRSAVVVGRGNLVIVTVQNMFAALVVDFCGRL